MLLADCGGPRWDGSFRRFIQEVFPDKQLVNIPDDDQIFRLPFTFTNGAPPLWHHGGWRALGIRHQDRWAVFYHPGDLNDAWKHGYSGLDKETGERALQLGFNIWFYALTQYDKLTAKYRK
jgi:hypothetical protein